MLQSLTQAKMIVSPQTDSSLFVLWCHPVTYIPNFTLGVHISMLTSWYIIYLKAFRFFLSKEFYWQQYSKEIKSNYLNVCSSSTSIVSEEVCRNHPRTLRTASLFYTVCALFMPPPGRFPTCLVLPLHPHRPPTYFLCPLIHPQVPSSCLPACMRHRLLLLLTTYY